MNHTLTKGDTLSLESPPGKAMDINISFADGTQITTTLAPMMKIKIATGNASNAINIGYIVRDDGAIRIVD